MRVLASLVCFTIPCLVGKSRNQLLRFLFPPFHMHPFSEVKCKSLIWLISQHNLISEDLGKAADEDVSF